MVSHSSEAAVARFERRERAGIEESTSSSAAAAGAASSAGWEEEAESEGAITVKLMVEFLTPAVAGPVDEDEEVSTTAECEPVSVVEEAAPSPSEDESTTIEWWPVDLVRLRPGRMLTWTVESSIPPAASEAAEAPATDEETSTRTEWSPRATLRRRTRRAVVPLLLLLLLLVVVVIWCRLMLTVEL